jgi:hypothetical protein
MSIGLGLAGLGMLAAAKAAIHPGRSVLRKVLPSHKERIQYMNYILTKCRGCLAAPVGSREFNKAQAKLSKMAGRPISARETRRVLDFFLDL